MSWILWMLTSILIAVAGFIMPPNLFGHTMSGLHVRQAAVAGVESSRDPFHEL